MVHLQKKPAVKQRTMENKSLEELERISKDYAFYSSEKRYLAILEIEKREPLSEELRKMKESYESSQTDLEEKKWILGSKNITNDPSAPLLYRPWVIYLFSILFSVLAGSILIALNFYQVNNKELGNRTVFFGAILTAIVKLITDRYEEIFILGGLNALLGGLLIEFIWKKSIDKNLKYRKRNFIIPFFIFIALASVIIYYIFINSIK